MMLMRLITVYCDDENISKLSDIMGNVVLYSEFKKSALRHLTIISHLAAPQKKVTGIQQVEQIG